MKQISRVVILAFALCLAFSVLASAQEIRINFQDKDTPVPEGWFADYHEPFGPKDNGLVYGWEQAETMGRNRDSVDPPQANTGRSPRDHDPYAQRQGLKSSLKTVCMMWKSVLVTPASNYS